jgi:hypothetical protein
VEWTIQDLGAIGEFVGAFAVVVTLIYLTLQVRQSTAQARLTSIQAVNASNDSAFDPIYIPENARVWTLGQEDPDALDPGEWRIFGLLMTRLIASFDTTTYQFEHGAYDADLYEGLPAFYGSMVSTPGGWKWYEANRHVFSTAVQQRLEEVMSSDAVGT